MQRNALHSFSGYFNTSTLPFLRLSGAAHMPTFSSCCLFSLCGRGGGISIPLLFVVEYGIALFCLEHSRDNFLCPRLRNGARGSVCVRTVVDFYLFWNFRKCVLILLVWNASVAFFFEFLFSIGARIAKQQPFCLKKRRPTFIETYIISLKVLVNFTFKFHQKMEHFIFKIKELGFCEK